MRVLERGLARALGAFARACGAVPLPARRRFGRGVGGLAHRLLAVRREVVERQVAASFPGRDPGWVADTVRRCYRHFGEEFALLAGGPERLDQGLERIRDPSSFEADLRAATGGGGCVIVSAHLGNWELHGAFLAALGLRPLAVARRQRPPWDAVLTSFRAGHDVELVHDDERFRRLAAGLAAGRPVLLVADQHATTGSARLDFLGRPAWTFLGPARLSTAARVPLLFSGLVRDGDGYRPFLVPIGPAAPGEGAHRARRTDPIARTEAWLAALERAIRAAPSQYFWFHRRWKEIRPERRPRPRGRRPVEEEPITRRPARAP